MPALVQATKSENERRAEQRQGPARLTCTQAEHGPWVSSKRRASALIRTGKDWIGTGKGLLGR